MPKSTSCPIFSKNILNLPHIIIYSHIVFCNVQQKIIKILDQLKNNLLQQVILKMEQVYNSNNIINSNTNNISLVFCQFIIFF